MLFAFGVHLNTNQIVTAAVGVYAQTAVCVLFLLLPSVDKKL